MKKIKTKKTKLKKNSKRMMQVIVLMLFTNVMFTKELIHRTVEI